jgi:hypothetical protein
MNATEYAKHRGVNKNLISVWIREGRLKGACVKKGHQYKIDATKADALLKQTLSPAQRKKPSRKASVAKSQGFDKLTLNEARTKKERYLAALRKLEYQEKQGELVKADEVKKLLTKLIGTSKNKLLSIKSEVGQLLTDSPVDAETKARIITGVENIVTEILKDLSNAK